MYIGREKRTVYRGGRVKSLEVNAEAICVCTYNRKADASTNYYQSIINILVNNTPHWYKAVHLQKTNMQVSVHWTNYQPLTRLLNERLFMLQ